MDDQPDHGHFSIVDTEVSPVSFMLKRAAQYSADLYAAQLGKSGLTQRQFTVLEAVERNEGGSQTTMVKETGIDRSTLADLINRLETQSYLRRKRSENDARVNFLYLTDQGRAALADTQPHVRQVDQALVESLPEKYRTSFIASLQLLSDKLDERQDG